MMGRPKKRRVLPPPSPQTQCYHLLCPMRNNCTQSAYSCDMAKFCEERKAEKEDRR